jgi:tRNA (guanine37-N1)-methyltransferase
MKYTILTLFPELILPFTNEAILGKAAERGHVQFNVINIRDFTTDKHRTVDDTPYGGGAGMVLRVDVVARALASLQPATGAEVVLFTPAGQRFTQAIAEDLAQKPELVLLCGRYEGFDARVDALATRELSLGDFVMMGGEAVAACVIEATARLLPGVLGDAESHQADSFSSGLLDYPEYTRPQDWLDPRGQLQPVPDILRSGHHAAIARWRRQQALHRTLTRRPDLLPHAALGPDDLRDLLAWGISPETIVAWGFVLPKPKRPKRSTSPTPPVA